MNDCPICKRPKTDVRDGAPRHVYIITCVRCGNYVLTDIASVRLDSIFENDESKRALISYRIRQLQNESEMPEISGNVIDQLLEDEFPPLQQQLFNLQTLIYDHTKAPGEKFYLKHMDHLSIVGAPSPDAFEALIKDLMDRSIIEGIPSKTLDAQGDGYYWFTVKGWEQFLAIIKDKDELNQAFMAMDFKNREVERIYMEVYRPLCKELGYVLNTVQKKAGLIDIKIRTQIDNSVFVIADLTDDNQGAYWEAGYAEGKKIPVIYSCEKNKFDEVRTHFDTEHLTTAKWDIGDLEFSANELKEIIIGTFPEHEKERK